MSHTKHHDLYVQITNDIIAAIEAGTKDFEMPWHGAYAGGLPKNALTGGYYHGINLLVLMIRARRAGFAKPVWATYRQWQELDMQVAKGQRGVRTILYKPMAPQDGRLNDNDHEDDEGRQRVYIRTSYLFNIAQTDGYEAEDYEPPVCDRPDQISQITRAEALVAAIGAEIVEGGTRAQYVVSAGKIMMPDRSRFDGRGIGDPTSAWYNTLFHELIHWSGAAHRLDRPVGTGQLADRAFEELVAEIGSAFMMAELGIPNMPVEGYVGYVAHWLQALKDDKRFIFKAAAEAGKAATFILDMESRDGVTAAEDVVDVA